MNVAVILAGGVGSRVGAKVPKQFIEVLGKPVIVYTLERFQHNANIDAIEVVCIESYIDTLKALIGQYGLTKVRWIVKGGEDFQHSVMHGIDNLKDKVKPDDIVLIHYAASPFVTDEILDDAVKVCKEKGNCTSATPTVLLCGSNDGGKSERWVDRDRVMQLNSPQCFKYSYVTELYEEAQEKGLIDKVEPHTTTLMFALGRTIYFSYGTQSNIKITTKEDLATFEGYVLYWQRHAL